MERHLYKWYQKSKKNNIELTARMVKNKAIQLSQCRDFIASKGWLDKFKVRYKLEIAKEQKGRVSSQMKKERLKRQQEAISNNYGSLSQTDSEEGLK